MVDDPQDPNASTSRQRVRVPTHQASCVLVMGVAGSGKSTVGALLARHLNALFLDADDFHPPENIRKMNAGIALDDTDREPWLAALCEHLCEARRANRSTVLACSALKDGYRVTLRSAWPELDLVWLRGSSSLLQQRLALRTGHFAGPGLLESQLRTLEPPSDALTLDASAPPDELVATIVANLHQRVEHDHT